MMSEKEFKSICQALLTAETNELLTSELCGAVMDELAKRVDAPPDVAPEVKDYCVLVTVSQDPVGVYGPMTRQEADVWGERAIGNWGSDRKITGFQVHRLNSPALGNRGGVMVVSEGEELI